MRGPTLVLALAAAAIAAAGAACAEVVSARPEAVQVVLYQDGNETPRSRFYDGDEGRPDIDDYKDAGLALVSETRVIDLPAGRQKISFRGVADGIMPQTAALQDLPAGVVERNYDFNLLSPGSLIAAGLGRPVRIVRINPATGAEETRPAVLRSGPAGVVLEIDGRFEALGCGSGPEKLVFDRVPEGLSDQPTLSVVADVARAGRYTIRLVYLATGLSWSADYVARVRPDGRALDLFGWLTLLNAGSTTFGNAPTQVVAGRLSRVEEEEPYAVAPRLESACWPMGRTSEGRVDMKVVRRLAALSAPAPMSVADEGLQEVVVTASRMAAEGTLGDYKLYTLPEPTTVAARQSKQVAFLDQKSARFETIHAVELGDPEGLEPLEPDEPVQAALVFRLQNRTDAGLGRPLPGGIVSVMAPTSRGPRLVGQAFIDDTAVGLPVELEVGTSRDVAATQTVLRAWSRGAGPRKRRYEIEVDIANAGREAAKVEVRQRRFIVEGFRIVSETRRHGLKNGDPLWSVSAPPQGRVSFRYVVEVDG